MAAVPQARSAEGFGDDGARGAQRRVEGPTALAVAIGSTGEPVLIRRAPLRPEPTGVVVDVAASAVCGSDLHLLGVGRLRPGTVLGHECAGTVSSIGDRVGVGPGRPKVGDRVVVRPHAPCTHCEVCRGGAPHLCPEAVSRGVGLGETPGGFAEQVAVDASAAVPIPPDLDFAAATLAEPLAVALHGIAQADAGLAGLPERGEIVVIGGGPIGVLTALALEALGHDDVVMVETGAGRAAHAQAHGIRTRFVAPGSARVVFQCAGQASATAAALDFATHGSTVILLGVPHEPVSIPQTRCVFKEITLRGAFGYRPEHFDRAVGLLARGTIRADDVITAERPLEELPELLGELRRHGTDQVKVVLRP